MSAHGSTLLTATLALLHTWQPLLLHSAAGCMIASVNTSSPKATCPPQTTSSSACTPPFAGHSTVRCDVCDAGRLFCHLSTYHLPSTMTMQQWLPLASVHCIRYAYRSQPASQPARRQGPWVGSSYVCAFLTWPASGFVPCRACHSLAIHQIGDLISCMVLRACPRLARKVAHTILLPIHFTTLLSLP